MLRSRYSHLGAREPFQDLTVAGCHWRRNISFGICDMCIDKPIHTYIYMRTSESNLYVYVNVNVNAYVYVYVYLCV